MGWPLDSDPHQGHGPSSRLPYLAQAQALHKPFSRMQLTFQSYRAIFWKKRKLWAYKLWKK